MSAGHLLATQLVCVPVEAELAKQHLLTSALDAIGAFVVVVNAEGNEVFRNQPAPTQPFSATDVKHVEDVASELLKAALNGKEVEEQIKLGGPPRRAMELLGKPIYADDVGGDSQGSQIEGAVVVIDDVTARHRVDKVRRDFVANISHELKTPVGAMSLLAETLAHETNPDVVARLVDRIHVEAERVAAMVDDLLDLAQVEAQDQVPDDLVMIVGVIEEAISRVETAAETSGIEIKLSFEEGVGERAIARGDRRQLVSAVHNLIENAVKYSEHGQVVEVAVEVALGRGPIVITVTDHGLGIPDKDLARVFERFYRVDRARTRETGGTGLGLAIVRHIAENHGGTVGVASTEGVGSTFSLRLPLVSGGSGKMIGGKIDD